MVSPGGPERSDGALARALGATSAVMLLAVIVSGFLVLRAIEDKDLAEKARDALDKKLAERSDPPASAPPVMPEAPETLPFRPACVPKDAVPESRPVAESRPPGPTEAEMQQLLSEIAELKRALAERDAAARAEPPKPPPPPPVEEAKPVLAAPATAAGQPAPDPVEAELRDVIDRALSRVAAKPRPSRDELLRVIETGPVLLPLLARHFRDPEKGPAAIRIAGLLPGVRVPTLVDALSDSRGSGKPFLDAATEALLDLARRGDSEALIEVASRPRLQPEVGIAVTAAVAQLADARAVEAVASALLRSSVEQMVATSLLIEKGANGRDVLTAALAGGRLSNEAALLVIGGLLPEARDNEAATLARAILDNDGGVGAASKSGVGPAAVPAVAAELLSVALTPERKALLARILGLEEGAGQDRVVAAALSNPEVCEKVRAILRERGRLAPKSGAELMARAKTAEPWDVPDLLEGLDLVDASDRAVVAGISAVFGHPEGARVLRRLSHHRDPLVRKSVVTAMSSCFLPDTSGILSGLIEDEDLDVASAAAAAFDLHHLPLDPARGVAALARLGDLESECALDAMGRTEGAKETITTLLSDALDRGAIRDVNAAATFLMTLNEASGPEFVARFFGHRDPLVRAAALRALRWPDADRNRWLSVLERTSADPDPLVRVAATRAMGRINDDIARARLVALMRDPSWLVREAAALSLAAQEKLHVIPVLRRAQSDPSYFVVNAARVALVRLGAVDVAPDLLPDLMDPAVGDRTREVLLAMVGARDLDASELAAAVERVAGVSSRPR